MRYGRKDKDDSKRVIDSEIRQLTDQVKKATKKLHGRVTANNNTIKKSYFHWISMYKMFLDPHITSNVIAMLIPKIMAFMKDYKQLSDKQWFVMFYLYDIPFATTLEISAALKLKYPGTKFTRGTDGLYKLGLVERKSSSSFIGKRYFYIISLKGRELVEVICSKTLSKEILNYINHSTDHLKYHKNLKKREKMVREYDWYDVPDVQKFKHTPFYSIPKENFKKSEKYQQWRDKLIAAGKWKGHERPPASD